MKNTNLKSKKGFTLVEIVVTVAILAILSGIAIPVIGYRIDQANRNTALTNASTIEFAIKEDQSAQASQDTSIYPNANSSSITIAEVTTRKAIEKAFAPVTFQDDIYTPAWSNGRVYFVNGTTTIDGQTLSSKTDITPTSTLAVSTL